MTTTTCTFACRGKAYKTASKAVVTETELAAPEPSTQNDDDYVYLRMPRKGMAPVDWAHRDGAAPGFPKRWATECNTSSPHRSGAASGNRITAVAWRFQYSARVAVVQPGRCGETIVIWVENEPHEKVLTQHLAGRLAVPGASAAAEVKVLMDSCSSITAMLEELYRPCEESRGCKPR